MVVDRNSGNITPSEWWRDHIKEEPGSTPALPPICDQIGSQLKAKREILGLMLASCLALFAGRTGAIGIPGYLIVQVALLLVAERRLRNHFHESPAGAARERHFQEVHLKSEEVEEKQARLEQSKGKVTEKEQQEKKVTERTQAQIAKLTGLQGMEIKQAYTDKAVALSELSKRKQSLSLAEEQHLREAIGQFETQLQQLQSELNNLPKARSDACQKFLEREHAASMHSFLANHYVSQAVIPGIGAKFKITLKYHGILTAADVTFGAVRIVPGFGYSRTRSIVAWREGLEAHYRTRLLNSLPPSVLQQIVQQFEARQATVESEMRNLRVAAASTRSRISQSYESRRGQLAKEEKSIEFSAQSRVNSINAKFLAQIASLRTDQEQQLRSFRKEAANARLSANNLESDIRRLHTWQRTVGSPRTKSYEESMTFPKYLKEVFTSKFNS